MELDITNTRLFIHIFNFLLHSIVKRSHYHSLLRQCELGLMSGVNIATNFSWKGRTVLMQHVTETARDRDARHVRSGLSVTAGQVGVIWLCLFSFALSHCALYTAYASLYTGAKSSKRNYNAEVGHMIIGFIMILTN
jgi:hypothetical protein